MKATPLLTGWTCRHLGDTAPGRPVTLPHDAMLAEPRTALSAGGVNTGWYEGYDYEYQRTLTVPENELSDTHILEFEGVYHNAEVWLNGQKAAFRPYGYTNFYVDCAPFLRAGDNELRVIARNADQPNSRGGIPARDCIVPFSCGRQGISTYCSTVCASVQCRWSRLWWKSVSGPARPARFS